MPFDRETSRFAPGMQAPIRWRLEVDVEVAPDVWVVAYRGSGTDRTPSQLWMSLDCAAEDAEDEAEDAVARSELRFDHMNIGVTTGASDDR